MADSHSDAVHGLMCLIIMGLIVAVLIMLVNRTFEEDKCRKLRQEAVKYGYARYEISPSEEPVFQWVVPPEKQETKP